MTLFDLVKLHGRVQLDMEDPRSSVVTVLAKGADPVNVEVEDVKFASGGAITLVHEVSTDQLGKAWADTPPSCEACQ